MSTPKPPNFAEMVDAWDSPEAFAALVRDYYAMLGVQAAAQARDLTAPLHPLEVD